VRVEFYGHDQLVTCALDDGTFELDVRLMGPHPDMEVGVAVRLEVTGVVQAFPPGEDVVSDAPIASP
jgi:hypothetical protein